MKYEIKPDYYDSFVCSADKCAFTCCKQWKIAVDDNTYKKWKKVKDEKGQCLKDCVTYKDEERVIALNEQKNCPYLKENELCKLVLQHGEQILSDTCHTFPRQIHEFADRTEYSLVSCCPDVIDIWNQLDKVTFVKNMEQKETNPLFILRSLLTDIIQNQHYSLKEAWRISFYILIDLYEQKDISDEVLKQYQEGKFIEKLRNTLAKLQDYPFDTFQERNELFLDLADNYRKEEIYVQQLEPLASLAEKLEDDYSKIDEAIINAFEKELKKYESLFRNFLAAELFTNMLIPDSDFESMLVMFQWMTIEYATIQQALFLYWFNNDKQSLTYETIQTYIVVLSRMTGYDQEDIYDYLESSFQSLIWTRNYFSLVC